MKKLILKNTETVTFEDGCNKYLANCKQRNLRAGSLKHYEDCYIQFYKFFDPEMPLREFTEAKYKEYSEYLKRKIDNSITIHSYLMALSATLRFLMSEGYVREFPMHNIKMDKQPVETYSDEELQILLKKPDSKHCSFVEYQCWVITNLLFSTGIRRHSLVNIKVKDIDLPNRLLTLSVTKNRKILLVPLSHAMVEILTDYVKSRDYRSDDDFLFCNAYGQPLKKSTITHAILAYNKKRGVETSGMHRYRHTFAKHWILNGGNVVTLSRLLGHSSLDVTQNYINLLTSDAQNAVDEVNLLDKFSGKKGIKLK